MKIAILALLTLATIAIAKDPKTCARDMAKCDKEGDNICDNEDGVSVVITCRKQGSLLCEEVTDYCDKKGGCK